MATIAASTILPESGGPLEVELRTPLLAQKHDVFCPRCGYDLAGDVEHWFSVDGPPACPIAGRCTECGIDFWWGTLFDSSFERVDGFAEHAGNRLQWWAWALRTWLWCWRPSLFWSRVRLEHPPQVFAAAEWLLLPLLVMHFTGTALLIGVFLIHSSQNTRVTATSMLETTAWVLPDPFGRLQVTFSTWPPRVLDWHSPFEAFDWWTLPLVASGIVLGVCLLLLRTSRRATRVSMRHVVRAFIYWLSFLWCFWISRLLFSAMLLATGLGMGAKPMNSIWHWLDFVNRAETIWILLIAPWSLWWWRCAIKLGWRIERPDRTLATLLIPAALAALFVLFVQAAYLGIWWPGA